MTHTFHRLRPGVSRDGDVEWDVRRTRNWGEGEQNPDGGTQQTQAQRMAWWRKYAFTLKTYFTEKQMLEPKNTCSVCSAVPLTFPLDAVLLVVLMWERVGPRLGQQVLRGARNAILTLGVLGAQSAGRGQALDVPTERTLAGANSLSHRAARHYGVLFGAACMRTHTHIMFKPQDSQIIVFLL